MTTGAEVGRRAPADRLDGQPEPVARAPAGRPPSARTFRAGRRGSMPAGRSPGRAPSATAHTPSKRAASVRPLGDEHQRARPVRHHHRRRAAGADLRGQRRRIARRRGWPRSRCRAAAPRSAVCCIERHVQAKHDRRHGQHDRGGDRHPGQPRTRASARRSRTCQPPAAAGSRWLPAAGCLLGHQRRQLPDPARRPARSARAAPAVAARRRPRPAERSASRRPRTSSWHCSQVSRCRSKLGPVPAVHGIHDVGADQRVQSRAAELRITPPPGSPAAGSGRRASAS